MRRVTAKDLDKGFFSTRKAAFNAGKGLFTSRGTRTRGNPLPTPNPTPSPTSRLGSRRRGSRRHVAPRSIRRRLLKRRRFLPQSG